ncbi:hypothetical protein, partial [Pseudonocardia sp. EV170527-09]|uniref:hypothetical protein n=1 Tax=Pseudonocardia sp. EV170527-09 TaxID=2603411 RepID=UPI0019602F13
PYFAEDPPTTEVLAVQGLDPAVVVAVRDETADGAGGVRYLVDPDAPPGEVDAAMTAIGAGPG